VTGGRSGVGGVLSVACAEVGVMWVGVVALWPFTWGDVVVGEVRRRSRGAPSVSLVWVRARRGWADESVPLLGRCGGREWRLRLSRQPRLRVLFRPDDLGEDHGIGGVP
jgi:hypothetical protein